jgi:hypothetical protein
MRGQMGKRARGQESTKARGYEGERAGGQESKRAKGAECFLPRPGGKNFIECIPVRYGRVRRGKGVRRGNRVSRDKMNRGLLRSNISCALFCAISGSQPSYGRRRWVSGWGGDSKRPRAQDIKAR